MKIVPDGLTYTQRTLWFRNNYPLLDMERETLSTCSNYQQLMMARGAQKRASERGEEWLGDLEDMTRTQRKLFYRRNEDLLDRERAVVDISSNYHQLNMAKKTWAQDISRTARSQSSLQSKEEESSNKTELWRKQANRRISMSMEDKATREVLNHWDQRNSLTHTAYDIHRMPWDWSELECAATSAATRMMRQDALEMKLNELTTSIMTSMDSITKYSMSAHDMARKAMREDEEAVAASRKITRKTVMQSAGSSSSSAMQQSSGMEQASSASSAMMQYKSC